MSNHHKINYLEMPSSDLESTKAFFSITFGWKFIDYGPDYISFSGAGIDGGFFRTPMTMSAEQGSALVVLYSSQLEDTQTKVTTAGGTITKPIFSFPGGRRFHFSEPSGNEFAVWSE